MIRLSPNKRDSRTEPGSKMELTHEPPSPSISSKIGSRSPKFSVMADKVKEHAVQLAFKFTTEPSVMEVRKQKQPDENGERDSLATFGSFENL